MIPFQYVREAIRIRTKHAGLQKLLDEYEAEVKKLKGEYEELLDDLKTITPSTFSVIKQKKLSEAVTKMNQLESKLKGKIEPIQEQMNKLRVHSDGLYDTLKEKYPHLTDEQLRNQLFSQIAQEKL